jgi:hypothetical protein
MIPSHVSSRLIQYTGFLRKLTPDLDKVNKIKVTDLKTQGVLFNSSVRLHNKREWSSDGYSQELRYHFERIDNTENDNSRIFFVSDKDSKRIKIMSLDKTYKEVCSGLLQIEYKTDERIKSDNLYEIEFGYNPEEEFARDDIDERHPRRFMDDWIGYG